MTNTKIYIAILFALAFTCAAEDHPARLLLWAHHGSSGPFGGEKATSCLLLYSDGRIVQISSSTAAMGVQDESGKITHAERRDNREYRFPERDSWQVSNFLDFLESKALRKLSDSFPPPHPPIDYIETSTVAVFLPGNKVKQIQTREYYVASLIEKARYPSALIILMDNIEQLENTVAEKGTPMKGPAGCSLEHPTAAKRTRK